MGRLCQPRHPMVSGTTDRVTLAATHAMGAEICGETMAQLRSALQPAMPEIGHLTPERHAKIFAPARSESGGDLVAAHTAARKPVHGFRSFCGTVRIRGRSLGLIEGCSFGNRPGRKMEEKGGRELSLRGSFCLPRLCLLLH